ncbi:MAG: hypothetical protein R3264_19340, partial [Anaerolineae bacterium]|nr:hypothetical protein [Anaerolineae bacterium]
MPLSTTGQGRQTLVILIFIALAFLGYSPPTLGQEPKLEPRHQRYVVREVIDDAQRAEVTFKGAEIIKIGPTWVEIVAIPEEVAEIEALDKYRVELLPPPSTAPESGSPYTVYLPLILSGGGQPVQSLTNGIDTFFGGYASTLSVTQGATIEFYISTDTPTYDLEIWREGPSRQLMKTVSNQTGVTYSCDGGYASGCGWPVAYTLNVP